VIARRLLLIAGLVALAAGCENGDHAHTHTRIGGDAGPAASQTDAEPGLATHGTFETARALTLGDFPGVLEVVAGREDVDFFSFEGTKGEWVVIRTTVTTSLNVSDTAIVVYDPDQQPIARNVFVDSFPGEGDYARVVMRLPADGKYYLTVGDERAPRASLGFVQPYKISVVDANTQDGYVTESERGHDSASATLAKFRQHEVANTTVDDDFFLGDFASPTDVDSFSFDVVGSARLGMVQIENAGVTGNGSTTRVGKAWITDETGLDTIARIDNLGGQSSMTPPLAPGKYVLFLSHPDAPLATNDFYVARVLLEPDNPSESADAANGTLATAEALTIEIGGGRSSAYVVSRVGENDIDYFGFDAQAGSKVTARCLSTAQGSGVVGLHLALVDDHDATLAEATEAGLDPTKVETPLPESGKLYLRLSKDSQLEDVSGDWVRCVVTAE
jgi:hypothetical protein